MLHRHSLMAHWIKEGLLSQTLHRPHLSPTPLPSCTPHPSAGMGIPTSSPTADCMPALYTASAQITGLGHLLLGIALGQQPCIAGTK